MHCFSGDLAVARRGLDLGLLISIAGPVTYPNARRLAEVVRVLPLDRLVVETDCPYLPPQPWRGQRNEPAYLPVTAARVAELLGRPTAAVADGPRRTRPGSSGCPARRSPGPLPVTSRPGLWRRESPPRPGRRAQRHGGALHESRAADGPPVEPRSTSPAYRALAGARRATSRSSSRTVEPRAGPADRGGAPRGGLAGGARALSHRGRVRGESLRRSRPRPPDLLLAVPSRRGARQPGRQRQRGRRRHPLRARRAG